MPRRVFGPDIKLSKQDLEVLGLVTTHLQTTGRAPSLREIATLRGHRSHGPSQRAVDALLATGRLTRDAEGQLAVPGLDLNGPAIAELLGGPERVWVPAPAHGMVAFRCTGDERRFSKGTLVYAVPGAKAATYDPVIATDGDKYFVSIASTQLRSPRGERQRDIHKGREIEVIGRISYELNRVESSRARARRSEDDTPAG